MRIIVPFPPGGGADTTARTVAKALSERWNQAVVVDNRPGANTIIGVQELLKNQPDGYTLLWAMDVTLTMNQALFTHLKYDPLKDFSYIGVMASVPLYLIAREETGVKSLGDFVAHAKAKPDDLVVGSASTIQALAIESLNTAAGIKTRRINFKGSSDALQAFLSNDTPFVIDTSIPYMAYVTSGRAKLLAVTSPQRLEVTPDVPTFAELGYGDAGLAGWFGLVGPAGMSPELVKRLNSEFVWALSQKEVKDRLSQFSLSATPSSPEELRARVEKDSKRYGKLIRDLGLVME